MAVQEPGRTKGFVCKHCGVVCANMPSLLEHMESHQELAATDEDRKFKCDECGRGYRHAGSLANHKKAHEVGSFQCHICERQLSNSLALKMHLRIHTSRKKYACTECGKAFRLATQLATHQRVHRNGGARGSGGSRRGSAGAAENARGRRSFDVAPDLEADMSLDLEGEEDGEEEDDFGSGGGAAVPALASGDKAGSSDDAGDRPFKCNMCDKSYRHYGSLYRHKESHQMGAFECPICFKQLNNQAAMTAHQRTHSKTMGGVPGSASGSAGGATHADRKPYMGSQQNGGSGDGSPSEANFCHLCQVSFPNEDEFQDHVLLHNSSSVSFELPVNMPDEDPGLIYSASQSPDYPPSSDTPPMPPLLDKQQEDYEQPVGSAENGQIYIPDDPFQDQDQELRPSRHPPALNSQRATRSTTSGGEDLQDGDDSFDHEVKEEDESESPDAGDRKFKCDVCHKSYRHAGSLINHKRSHQTGVYQCSICRKNYPHLAALRSHHRLHRAQTSAHGAEGDWLSSEPQTLENQHGGYPPSDPEMEEDLEMGEEGEELGESLLEPPDVQVQQQARGAPAMHHEQGMDQQQHHQRHNRGGQQHSHIQHASGDEGGDAMGYQDQYDVPYPQDGTPTGHLPHDDGGPPPAHLMERHMCADCGKTFGDIASIKSHPCPMRQAHHHPPHPHHHHNQQQDHHSQHPHPHHHNSITNGSHSGHMDYHHHSPHLIGETGTPVGYDSSQGYYGTPDHHNPHHPQQGGYHQNMHAAGGGGGGMMGTSDPARGYGSGGGGGRGMQDHNPHPRHNDEDNYDGGGEEEDEEDGEMYHCSVCGNHYASMGALRSHLRGHTQVHGTPSSSGPSSMSSLEAEKDEEPGGESHQGDGSLIICSTCGESFTRKQDLMAHQLMHNNQNQAPSINPVDHHHHHHHPHHQQQQYPHHQSPMQHLGPPAPPPPPLTHYGSSPNGSMRSSKAEPARASNSSSTAGGGGGGSLICNKCGISCVSFQHLENHPCPGRRLSNEVKSEVIKPDVEAPMLGRNDARRPKGNQDGGGVGGSGAGVGGDRVFKCDQCGRAYRHAGSLLNHKKSHKTGVFRCYVCQKRFYNLLALKSHERTHFDIKKHTCNECGKAFKIQKQLQNHLRVHEENKAKIQELNKQIQTLMQMNGELAQNGIRKAQRRRRRQPSVTGNGSAGPSPEKGSDGGGSSTVQSPGAAAGTPHDPNDPRPYVCNQCGRSYRHAGSLVNHKNSHKTGEYHCSICNNTYSNQLAMKNHLRIHFGLKKHACQECGKAFRGKKQLLSHRCAANRKNADGNGPPRSRSGRRKPRLPTCRKCRQSFPTPAELEAHECKGPPPGAAAGDGTPREERPYKCGICGRSYRHAGSLLNHKNTHNTGHFSCTFCSKPFSNPMALRSHTRIHTQKKKHVCPTCGKAFRLSSILHNHLKIHTRGNCTFSCPTCNKTFQGRSGLKRHRCLGAAGGAGAGGGSRSGSRSGGRSRRSSANGQEGGDRCYTCDQCGRSYRHAGSLLNHKKTHSADLLNCGLCLRTFADAAELERHSQMPRHCCPDCGKTFCEFAHMQSHMEVHSKGRPLQGAITSPTGSVGSGASGSGYPHHHPHPHPLHHPHQQQQHHPHPHHHHLGHPHHPQQMHHPHPHHPHIQTPYPGYPPRHHPDGMPMAEDEMDWHSGGMDPRGMGGPGSGGSLPKIGQAFGAGGGGGTMAGGGGGDGGSGSGAYPSDMQDHGEEDDDGGAPGGGAGDPEEKSHVCEHCGRAYRHAGSLLNHKNSHKTGSFFCAVCQKEFTNLMALKNHRRIHTEPKRYQCLECGKAFRVSTQLICHRRIHTKEKPFSCLLCDKRFSSKSNLRHHQKMHQNSQASYEAAFDMDPGSFMGLGVDPFL
ncbi:zinc finger protein 646 [Engraulis encrasicolus]|uniref:zinc finger protein 646 n=1 Tax=Engraulis encrasicolus TaxID=184585 RepID=UPI002FD2B59C